MSRDVFCRLLQAALESVHLTPRSWGGRKSLRWCGAVVLIAPALGDSPPKNEHKRDETAAIHGLPFTRSYPFEEIGNVPRGARLGFDRFGRLAVFHDGFYMVLNDTTWLDLVDKESGVISMPVIVQGPDGRVFYAGFGSWGLVELTAEGKLRPRPLLPPNPPKWALTTAFSDVAVTGRGVFFGGWSGVVYWDFATQKYQFFEVVGFSKLFSVGDQAYVSAYGSALRRIDISDSKLRLIDDTNYGEDAIAQSTNLDRSRALVSTRSGRILMFDGNRLTPWPGQQRYDLTGRVTCLERLIGGGVAVAVAGKGLFVVSKDGEMISALTGSEYHRITQLATRESGVLWASGEYGIQKVLYGSPLTVFGQRLGLNPSWPLVVHWNGRIVVATGGGLFEAIPGADDSASHFEPMKNQPAAGAWAVTASGPHLLVGNGQGAFAMVRDVGFTTVVPRMDVARLEMLGEDLCFAIGRSEIAVIRWTDGRWMECAPRIPSLGYPSLVHCAKKSMWIELGAGRVVRLTLEDDRLYAQVLENFPWKEKSWVNVGIVDDTVVLSGPPGGRVFYDENTGKFCEAPELQRLLDQSPSWILRVRKDQTGTLWATHDQGVITFTPKNGKYEIDTTTFDLNNEHFPVVQLLPDNDVWMSTGQSLYHVDQRRVFEAGSTLHPMLVSVADGRTNAELFGDPIPSSVPLQLPYAKNNLSFRFFAGSYAWRRAPIYEFRLSSGQDRWTSLGTGSLLSFPGLREGNYHLDVRIANALGPIGPPASLQFEILPPWQRTWPAYTLYGMSAAFAIFGLVRWSGHHARRRNLALEKTVGERTHELKITMLKLNDETRNAATLTERDRLAGEIHDSLQQGLSGLMLQLDATLKLPVIAADVRSRLNVARNMVSFTRHEVQHAVWDMESPLLEGTELGEALRKIAALIGTGTTKIEIAVSGDAAPLPTAIQHHLLRIAQEAITNAVRHAGPTTITVRLEYQHRAVRLSVEDDGVGFNPDEVLANSVGHFGLRGLRGRAAKIGGELRIESFPGKGTRIEIIAPLPDESKPASDTASHAV